MPDRNLAGARASLSMTTRWLKQASVRAWRILNSPPIAKWLKLGFAMAVFCAAAAVIARELQATRPAAIVGAFRATSASRVVMAALAVGLSYLCLGATETWVLRCLGRSVGWLRALAVSFVAYALANSIGFGPAAVSAVRLRFYRPAGLQTRDIAAVSVLAATVVTLSGLLVAGLGLILVPTPSWLKAVGLVLAAPLGLLAWRRNRRVMGVEIRPPRLGGRAAMLLFGAADWVFSGGALFLLLPQARPAALPDFLAVFVLGSVVSSASGVPAGIGVFEAVLLGLGAASGGVHETFAALVIYRLINAIGPLALAGFGVACNQLLSSTRVSAPPGQARR